MRMTRMGSVLVALVLLLAACGGDDDSTDTTAAPADDTSVDSAPATTAEAAPTTTIDDGDDDGDNGEVSGLGELPGECRDALVDYLQALEPYVEDLDFETATLDDLSGLGEAIETDPELSEFEGRIDELNCPEVDNTDPGVQEEMLALARDAAPGTVAFVEYAIGLAEDFGGGEGEEASGDCETDIAAVEEYIASGDTMNDLTLAEVSAVGSLVLAIQANCPADRMEEFFTDPDVAAFLGG